ncbi:MAG: DUF1837 domain-containing protein [Phaeodactylibacter sp.]|nr:DUF1837 domain-containing protein [Phaeodactylibacter sp.]
MKKQEDLIGKHPEDPDFFSKWLSCEDKTPSKEKKHRCLKETELDDIRIEAIEWLSDQIVKHHVSENRLEAFKKKYEKLGKLGFKEYVEKKKLLPNADKVKKGNATEVLLTEYIKSSIRKPNLLHIYKFRYNPNVDQSIKGDDALLFDTDDEENIIVFLGEAKYRGRPDKDVVEDISKNLSKDKVPLSINYVCEKLWDEGKDDLAQLIEDLDIEMIKKGDQLICVGMFLSAENTERIVERNLESDNENMVFVSIGLPNPAELIKEAFNKANEKLQTPKES